MRLAVAASALFALNLSAADFSGRWAGTMETGTSRAPIYLTLTERAQARRLRLDRNEYETGLD